ncbi:MAG: hypothetical protein Q9168_005145 [Polycauliona sp. 1 TL-2023]
MAVAEESNGIGTNVATQSTQLDSLPTECSPPGKSARSIDLEVRYQELLERRIIALEKQLASSEPIEGPEIAPVTSETDTKAGNEGSASDATKVVSTKGDQSHKVGSKSQVQKTIMILDDFGFTWRPETPKAAHDAKVKAEKDAESGAQYAFKFTEYYKQRLGNRMYKYSEIEIFSEELRTMLKETLGQDWGIAWDKTDGALQSPYKSIIYSWDKFVEQTVAPSGSDTEEARQTREALGDLLECIKTSQELKDFFKTRDTNIASQLTTYKYLWTLFPSATPVIASPFMGTRQLFLVEDIEEVEADRDSHESYWKIVCIYLDFDTSFTRRMIVFKVKNFEGTTPLKALECYPTRFMDHQDEFLKTCAEQGRVFKEFCFGLKGAQKLFSYRGNATSSGVGLNHASQPLWTRRMSDSSSSIFSGSSRGSDNQSSRNIVKVKGQVIVDYGAWNRWGPGDEIPNMGDATAVVIRASTWLNSTIHKNGHPLASKAFDERCKNGKLLDDEYALLPPRLLGYIPVKRIFAQLAVKHLSLVDNTNKDDVWNSDLILNEAKKKIIKTLVENHAQMAHNRTPDLVEGKGKGLVILLHGPPGVGKSLTAECVAKATSKPLFTVGVADIGTDSQVVEEKLNKLFSLAAEWDAVLLIDEADVFMEQRGSTDGTLERNALVSVLLRVLEYYEGILILTTNRVLSFDVAVQSRIHLAVMFHDLDDRQTRSIIEVHLNNRHHNLKEDDLDRFTDLAVAAALNGRQIRNVISSVEAVVNRRDGRLITWTDIKSVLNHTKEFQQSLQDFSKQQRANNEAQGRKRGS